MKVVSKHENISDCRIRLKLEIAAEELRSVYQQNLKKTAKQISMPGFRKGKVPQNMVVSAHGEAIREEVISQVVSAAVRQVIEEEKIEVYGNPNFEDGSFDKNASFDKPFKVNVIAYRPPSCRIKALRKQSIVLPQFEISAKDIDKAQQEKLRPFGKMEDIEGNPQAMDIITLDLKFSDQNLTKFDLQQHVFYFDENGQVTPPVYLQGIEGVLKSIKVGEEKTFKHKFPVLEAEEYSALSKTKTELTLKLISAKRMVLPKLDDQLLEKIGYASIEDMEKKIKEDLQSQAKQLLQDKKTRLSIDELKKSAEFEIPEPAKNYLISHYWKNYTDRYVAEAEREAAKPNQQWLDQASKHAIAEIEDELIFTELVNMHEQELKVDEQAIKDELKKMEERVLADEKTDKEQKEKSQAQLKSKEAVDRVRNMLEKKKVLEFIFSRTEVKKGKPKTMEELFSER